jgi:hypothetical protein
LTLVNGRGDWQINGRIKLTLVNGREDGRVNGRGLTLVNGRIS